MIKKQNNDVMAVLLGIIVGLLCGSIIILLLDITK